MPLVSKVFACLGDSLTYSPPSRCKWPWTARLDSAIHPTWGTMNCGVLGNVLAQMQTRYNSNVKNKGYHGVILFGGVNDILNGSGSSAAATFATGDAICADVLAAGKWFVWVTCTPFKNCGGWTVDKQTDLEAYNALVRARTPHAKLRIADAYPEFGTPAPGDAAILNPAYEGFDLDKLHFSDAGHAALAALLAPIVTTLD